MPGGVASCRRVTCAVMVAASVLVGCGYQSARVAGGQKLCVEPGSEASSYPHALSAAVAGVRDALAQRGMLGTSCGAGDTLVVSVQRVRVDAEGIIADVDAARPLARAARVGVTVSAQRAGERADPVIATEHAVVASQASPIEQEQANSTGVVTAARRAGDLLVRRIAGEPGPAQGVP